MDSVSAIAKFAAKENVNYPLLSDVNRTVAKAYGVLSSSGTYSKRVTFIVDPEGIVRHVFNKVDVRNHGDQVSKQLTALRATAGATNDTGAVSEEVFKALHELKDSAPKTLKGEMMSLGSGKAYLSSPEGQSGSRPAILLIHEWWGLNDHIKHCADRFSAMGYVALAVDLYKGTVATTRDGALSAMRGVDGTEAQTTIAHAIKWLKNHPASKDAKIASIGWCFGGAWSLKTALGHPDLDACVIYYGRLKTDPETLKAIKAPVLGIFGEQDRSIPVATVKQFEEGLNKAGVINEITLFKANHAFANPSSARYDQASAAKAWAQTQAFLKKHLGPTRSSK